MNIRVKTHHVDITPALKEYARKKMEKLGTFFENIQDIIIELNVEDNSNIDDQQQAHVTIYASGTIIRAEESSKDMYASIDLTVSKLEIQLKKYKERLKNKKKPSLNKLIAEKMAPKKTKSGGTVNVLDEADLFIPKPMEAEAAAETLKEKKLPFIVFRNFYTEDINVMYPIGENQFGLIDP